MKKEKIPHEMGILIVDDDSFLVKMLVKTLALGGFLNVRSASTGAESLQILGIVPAKDAKPADPNEVELVISDIVLPDLNGFELCSRIKKSLPKVSMILISGYDIQDINLKIIESGAEDFLIKPFNTAEMITRISMILERKRIAVGMVPVGDRPIIKIRRNYNLPYIGDRVGGYVIIDFLGWGRTNVIYKVLDTSSNTVLAMKMLTRNASEALESVERFENEIKIMASVVHPNIIEYKDKGKVSESLYVVMEYIDGMDLEELLITRGKIPEEELFHIAHDVADGIREIHRNNIIHRDIKLKNILYEHKTGEVKISDFGIARVPESLDLTKEGFVLGTPLYMAPEALHGEKASVKTDIYSYGATIYHLVTGTAPFTAENSVKLAEKIRDSTPRSMRDFRRDLMKDWDSLIVEKCLKRNPAERPSSMDEIMGDLEKMK